MYTKKSPGLMIFLIAVTVFLLNAPSAIAGKNPIVKHVEDAIIENLDLTPGNDERATITFPFRKGINYDGSVETGVWFILTDISITS